MEKKVPCPDLHLFNKLFSGHADVGGSVIVTSVLIIIAS